jgi:hypothetical protein
VRRGLEIALVLLGLAAAMSLGVAAAAADQAAQLRPLDLRVFGGEQSWHPDNDFRLDWDRPPVADQGFPVTAVDYLVHDAAGATVIPLTHLPWETTQIENIHLPRPVPGVYTAEVWLEGPNGQPGPPVPATLRFDDARPSPAQPLAAAGWVAGNAAAVVRIGHPAAPFPISGIRGYAVSVDRGNGSAPCGGEDRCSLAETDLRDGLGDDTIALGVLPEGRNVVRAVAVSGSGMRSTEPRTADVWVDATRPEVTLAGVPAGWAGGPVRLTAVAADPMSGMEASGPNGPFTAIGIDGSVPKTGEGGSLTATVTGDGAHAVIGFARDAAGNLGADSAATATVRIDQSPPAVAFANRQDPGDPERIEATVADSLSGPDLSRGTIAVRPAGSHQPFQALPTTAAAGRLVARWDSDAAAPGSYEFRAGGYDRAGNAAVSDRRANGTRMVLANPLKKPSEIQVAFVEGRRRSRVVAVRYAHGASLSGRLSLPPGAPIGGVPVEIVETFAPGSEPAQRTTTVETAADGGFAAYLAAGPSRTVEASFGGNRTLGRSSLGAMRMTVLSGVRLRASASSARVGGAPVVFSGRIGGHGAQLPSTGRPIELQFRFAGGRWAQFRTVQTDAHGRFRYAYAFSDDDSRGVRFQFRAFTPAEEGWPYAPAASKPISVVGR